MKELSDSFSLFFVKEAVVGRELAQVFEITEKDRCVNKVLVSVVEVTYEDFAPKVEAVQRFVASGD